MERTNKTIMCSVLFLDIVAYSKKSVAAQIAQKELFNALLSRAISRIPANDRVILDTGDGAAVTFLGDVEDALKVVLEFRESLLNEGAAMEPPLQVCMGINLGPVRLVKDINSQINIVGDGINVAQRIMGFAKPGQILVSRSYFDAASRLSQEYAGMFYYGGTRADKHEREHEIYSIGQPGDPAYQTGEDSLGLAVDVTGSHHGISPHHGSLAQRAIATFQSATGVQRAMYVGIAGLTLILLIVVTLKITHRFAAPEAQTPEATPDIQAAVSAPVPAQVKPALPAEAALPPLAEPAPPPTTVTLPAVVSVAPEVIPATKPQRAAEQMQTLEPGTHNVGIAVTPWGEVYLDGKKQGVSPPLDGLNVRPGNHVIEIRNTTFPPYTQNIQVKAGEPLKIKHKFTNKPEGEER